MLVLHEDNHLLCVVKPVNTPSQGDDSGDADLLTLAKAYIGEKYNKPGAVYLGLVHRLDRPVGGVMVFARTSKAAQRLNEAMKQGKWQKRYLAVVEGSAPFEGALTDFLLKDEGSNTSRAVPQGTPGCKQARLSYRRLAQGRGLSLIEVTLDTGRHHQIRVQLSAHGLPLWGDARYNPNSRPGEQLALYAVELCFPHPVTRECITVRHAPEGRPWTDFEGPLRLGVLGLKAAYEDENLVVIDKKPGIEVEGPGSVEELLQTCFSYIRPCHRLDAMTAGLVIFAKTEGAYEGVCAAIKARGVNKTYRCTVVGAPPQREGLLRAYALKDAENALVTVYSGPVPGAKEMLTGYRVLKSGGGLSTLEVKLITGRTHQIRAHLAFAGCPVLGDDKYGDREANRVYGVRGQALAAVELEFGAMPPPLGYLSGRVIRREGGLEQAAGRLM